MATTKRTKPAASAAKKTKPAKESSKQSAAEERLVRETLVRAEVIFFAALSVVFLVLAIAKYI